MVAHTDEVSSQEKRSIIQFLDSIHFQSKEVFIFIDKSDYQLFLLQDTVFLKEYAVVLGSNAIDDKLRQGDGCTPEGIFSLRDKYPHSKWNKFMWIDYPNDHSRKKQAAAIAAGNIAAGTAIGGEVGIHGVPAGMDWLIDQQRNWTLGCISLRNKDVSEVYERVQQGTRIIIRK
ncbi:MAG: L,D-transpeptidase [Chitinophagales bacterium]